MDGFRYGSKRFEVVQAAQTVRLVYPVTEEDGSGYNRTIERYSTSTQI